MGLTQTSGPAVEPLSLTDAKLHCRIDGSVENTMVTAWIQAAREYVENFTRRQLITATWAYTLDAFPATILVPRPPLQSVTSLAYVDSNGDTQTLTENTDFVKNTGRVIGQVYPAYGESWPATRWYPQAVTLTYVAGYGDAASDVPQAIVAAIKLLVAHWYENREAVVVGTITAQVPIAVESLLWPYRVFMEVA